MTSDVRALLIIAASELSSNEIRSLAQRISKEGPSWLTQRISLLREGEWTSGPIKSVSSSKSGYDQERMTEYQTIIKKVENLLIKEAGMSKTSAVTKLSSSIKSDLDEEEPYVPSGSKIAFDIWLARLFDAVPPSLVLHHASKIRNEIVHGSHSRSNWPLSQADD